MLTFPALGIASASHADEVQDVVVVVGAPGTDEFAANFEEWADNWIAAAESGGASWEEIGRDTEGSEADRDHLLNTIRTRAQRVTPEPLWIVLIGHGTFDGRAARFNLRGPDIEPHHLETVLDGSSRPVVLMNCFSCSAPFINELSKDGRVVITATKDGSELQFSRFGGFLSHAISSTDADTNRDGQTSLLEAWLYASRQTEAFYKSDGRLSTEHSLLDDTGDGRGTRADVYDGVRIRETVKDPSQVDGRQAQRWHLVRSEQERQLTSTERSRRDDLEQQLEILRNRRRELTEEEYLTELERLLQPLARIYAAAEQRMTEKPAVEARQR